MHHNPESSMDSWKEKTKNDDLLAHILQIQPCHTSPSDLHYTNITSPLPYS